MLEEGTISAQAVLASSSFWVPERLEWPSAWVEHIPFAFWIVGAHQPRAFVELGTHSGNSYLAVCQAVQRYGLATKCFAVDTWRGDEHAGWYGDEVFQDLARYHDARYSQFSRLVRSTFDEAVGHFNDGTIDLLHIDGLHTYEAVKHDFDVWRPRLSARAVVLFHDTNVRERGFGVHKFWAELATIHPSFEFYHGHGLGVLGVGPEIPAAVSVLFQIGNNERISAEVREAYGRLGRSLADVEQLRQRVAEREQQVRDFLSSTSWRITAPIRWAKRLVGG